MMDVPTITPAHLAFWYFDFHTGPRLKYAPETFLHDFQISVDY